MNAKDRERIKAERRRNGYCRLSNSVMMDPAISHSSKTVYAILCGFAGNQPTCYPSQEKIAAGLGKSISRVKEALRELEAHGIIERRRNWAKGESRNVYIILDGYHDGD